MVKIYRSWTSDVVDGRWDLHSRYEISTDIPKWWDLRIYFKFYKVSVNYDPNQLVLKDKSRNKPVEWKEFTYLQVAKMAGFRVPFWWNIFKSMTLFNKIKMDRIMGNEDWSPVPGYCNEDQVQQLIVRSALTEFLHDVLFKRF